MIITDTQAVHLRATQTFKDFYGITRNAGSEWLITEDVSSTHILDIYEQLVGPVRITVLNADEFCYIQDPLDPKTGSNQVGKRILKQGPDSFFLNPGESIHGGVRKVFILTSEQGLLMRLIAEGEKKSGEQWIIRGPCRYVPPVEAEIVEERQAIILDINQGVYVRDLNKGDVKIVRDKTYMLEAHEVLFEKIDPDIDELLFAGQKRDKTRAVTIALEHNEAVHIYKEKDNSSRVVLGPDLVMLDYNEHVTRNVLSGKTPKEEGVIKTLKIKLGPDFMTDIFKVETANNAKMRINLSYNWHFEYDPKDQDSLKKIFNVRDFVGDTCRELKSKVVAEVASKTLDEFHKNSARIIRASIFGMEHGKVKDRYVFETNNLVITNVDIKFIESMDKESQASLQEIVKMAIQITTDQVEAEASAAAEKEKQEALAKFQISKTEDDKAAEVFRKQLYELQNETKAVQKQGVAVAEQRAKAEADSILADTEVKIAQFKAQICQIETNQEISYLKEKQSLELD